MYFFKNKFVHKEDIQISPDDRGYYFGDGIYEVFAFTMDSFMRARPICNDSKEPPAKCT